MRKIKNAAAGALISITLLCLIGVTSCATIPAGTVTPLHEAVRDGNTDEAIRLIKDGADVNAKDENAETPLHYCANNGEPELLSRLLEGGADPNATDKDGNTPLHFAARNCYSGLVRLLIEYGADAGFENDDGAMPFDFANEAGCRDVAGLLLLSG